MILIVFVLFAQQVTATPTVSAIQGGTSVTFEQNQVALYTGGTIIVECGTSYEGNPPKDCKLVNGHTLDDVMSQLWQENQLRQQLARDYAERLKKDLALIKDVRKTLKEIEKEKTNAKP